jgi:RNA polymerase sigma factor (sigma-70 family)
MEHLPAEAVGYARPLGAVTKWRTPPRTPAPAPAGRCGEVGLVAEDLAGTAPVDVWTPPSWEEIVRTHSSRVYRLAYRLTGNRHDAEDLTQEVFVRVFRSLSTYTPGTFQGWLHRITTNLFLDLARRRQRIRFDALPDDAPERLPGSEPSPAEAYDDRHLDADIQAALEALPPEFRAAVVLCDIEGLSYEEIAATLGVKLGTVRSRIHRGRSQLREALRHRMPVKPPVAEPTTSQSTNVPEPAEPARHEPAERARPEGSEGVERPEPHPAAQPAGGGGGSVW